MFTPSHLGKSHRENLQECKLSQIGGSFTGLAVMLLGK